MSLFCSYCVSYHLRKRALHNDMSRYLCCNGDLPCSGRCGETQCPRTCLVAEVIFCFPQSVASTRWLLQDEMKLRNTQCDNCIITSMFMAQYLSCLCSLAACLSGNDVITDMAIVVDHIADLLWCSVCACMQTQHKIQMDARDANPEVANPYNAPPTQTIPVGRPVEHQQPVQPYQGPTGTYGNDYSNQPYAGYQGNYQGNYQAYPPADQGGYQAYPPPTQGAWKQ